MPVGESLSNPRGHNLELPDVNRSNLCLRQDQERRASTPIVVDVLKLDDGSVILPNFAVIPNSAPSLPGCPILYVSKPCTVPTHSTVAKEDEPKIQRLKHPNNPHWDGAAGHPLRRSTLMRSAPRSLPRSARKRASPRRNVRRLSAGRTPCSRSVPGIAGRYARATLSAAWCSLSSARNSRRPFGVRWRLACVSSCPKVPTGGMYAPIVWSLMRLLTSKLPRLVRIILRLCLVLPFVSQL